MKQILVIVPFPMSDQNLAMRKQQLKSVQLCDEMEFTFRPVKAAPKNYVSEADMVLADIAILEAIVGPGRASMLMALMLGHQFSIITMWKKWHHLYDKTLNELGINANLASIRSIDVAPDNQALLDGKEDKIFPLLESAARQAIDEDGADVILLGSTTMHQAHTYLASALEVPVINPGPLAYKMVESLLGLGLSHSSHAYPKSLAPRDRMLHAMMKTASEFDH